MLLVIRVRELRPPHPPPPAIPPLPLIQPFSVLFTYFIIHPFSFSLYILHDSSVSFFVYISFIHPFSFFTSYFFHYSPVFLFSLHLSSFTRSSFFLFTFLMNQPFFFFFFSSHLSLCISWCCLPPYEAGRCVVRLREVVIKRTKEKVRKIGRRNIRERTSRTQHYFNTRASVIRTFIYPCSSPVKLYLGLI